MNHHNPIEATLKITRLLRYLEGYILAKIEVIEIKLGEVETYTEMKMLISAMVALADVLDEVRFILNGKPKR